MSSTERKRFLQTRTSTAAERRAYRAERKAAQRDYYNSPEGKAEREMIERAHREYMATRGAIFSA